MMKPENVILADPFDTAEGREWEAQLAAAMASYNNDKIELARCPDIGSPEHKAALMRQQATQEALANATRIHGQRLDEKSAAEEAVDTAEHQTVPRAQQAVDDATAVVSAELGELMASATTSASLTATIDGLALRERYRAGSASQPPAWGMATIPFLTRPDEVPVDPQVRLPVVGDSHYTALIAVLDALDDSVDAIVDLVAAEGVHQLVGGNLARSGAALEIAASGTVPDDLDVIRTPAPGYDLTHRILVLGDAAATPAWRGVHSSVICQADPAYAAWLAGLLPDPARVHLAAVALDAQTQEPLASVQLTADALGLDPVDWVRVTADPGELAARVAFVARPLLSTAFASEVTGPILPGPPAHMPADGTTLQGMLAACASARAATSTARGLTAADFAATGEQPDPTPPHVEATAVSAVTVVQDALTALDEGLAAADALAEGPLIEVLLAATALGLAEATPAVADGLVDVEQLRAQAAAARARLASRLAHPRFAATTTGPDATLAAARELLPTLCGAAVPLLLPVPLPASAALRADLREESPPMPGADPTSVREWLLDHARVRPAVAALLDAFDAAETLGGAATLRPRATHLPRADDVTWAGVNPAPTPGLVDVVALRIGGPTIAETVTGLAVDTWVQTVPSTSHDTGLAFHYDEPNADPPQAILVAVAPDLSPTRIPARWDLASLVGTITSTMALARDRAVAADLMPDASVQIGEGS